MAPAKSTPATSENTNPLLAAALSSKKKKSTVTEKENVGAEPPVACRKRGRPATAAAQQGGEDEQPTEPSLEEITNQLAATKAALEKERAANTDLQKKLNDTVDPSTVHKKQERTIIPQPAGTAGKDWSIQEEMGLSKTIEGHKTYQALIRQVHDITLQSRINWEVPWSQVPLKEKVMLFDVARERNPIFKHYQNDWATEALVKQYVKNKRRRGYSQGWLEVPEKYAYLKENASKRSSAPRKKRVQGAIDAAKKRAAVAASKRAAVVRGKRRAVDDDSDEEDDEGGKEEEEGQQSSDMDTE